jgi:hypothetical protein
MQHQAQGLQRLFSAHAARTVSVLAGPSAPTGHEFVLALAAELLQCGQAIYLVDTGAGELSHKLGCRPLLAWQPNRPLGEQVIHAGAYGLLHAPGCLAGDRGLADAAAASRACDFLLFGGGRFSRSEAPLDAATPQTLVLLLGRQDAEAGYALLKALNVACSPARVLLLGEAAELVAQTAKKFPMQNLEHPKTAQGLYQNGNRREETSSNTLTFAPNLTWVVSRITQNDQPRVAHGGSGKSAEKVYKR